MRDEKGWNLTKKQREKYLDAVKMLYAGPNKDPVGIVPPRANLEDLRLRVIDTQEAKPAHTAHGGTKVLRGTPKPKHRKEWKEQADIYHWTQTIQTLQGFVMKFDNERRRNVVQAAVAKRMGLLAGASDLFIAVPCGRFCGLWIEVKQDRVYTPAERKKESWLRQEGFQARMISVGFAARFAFGAEDGIKIIKSYLNLGIRKVTPQVSPVIPPDKEAE